MDDPKQNYFLKYEDIIGDEIVKVATDNANYVVQFTDGIITKVKSTDTTSEFDLDKLNAEFEAGADLGSTITGETQEIETMNINELIKECIREVMAEEYNNLEEAELLQEYYGGYQLFIFDNGRAFISRYPDAHDELASLGKPKAVSIPIDLRKLVADYGKEQLEPLTDKTKPNTIEIPLDKARMFAAQHKLKFKKLVDAGDIRNYPQGADNSLKSKAINKRVAVAGQSDLDDLLYADAKSAKR